MAGRGYRLIAPSRFGYLGSSMPPSHAAMQADAYAQLLDRLGIEKVMVVGISAGAWSSMQFAIRHPERCGPWCSWSQRIICRRDSHPRRRLSHSYLQLGFRGLAALKLMPAMPGEMTRMMLAPMPRFCAVPRPQRRPEWGKSWNTCCR